MLIRAAISILCYLQVFKFIVYELKLYFMMLSERPLKYSFVLSELNLSLFSQNSLKAI